MKKSLNIAMALLQFSVANLGFAQAAATSSAVAKSAFVTSSYSNTISNANLKFTSNSFYNTNFKLRLCLSHDWLCAGLGLDVVIHNFAAKLSSEVSTRIYSISQTGGAPVGSMEIHPLGWALPSTTSFLISPWIGGDYAMGYMSSSAATENSAITITQSQVGNYKRFGVLSGVKVHVGSRFRMMVFVGKQRVIQTLEKDTLEFDVVPIGGGFGITL